MRSSPSSTSEPLDHAAVRSIILGILLAIFLSALDQTIVATALPTIGRQLGGVEHLSWVVSAYLLAATAATPLYGKLSDIHGRRVTLLSAILIFMAGSLACALAPTMPLLILARALQGLGGGGLISLAQTIIADVVSPRERGRYQGYIATVFVTSSIAGPVLGGLFARHLHWSLIFWINLPLGLLALSMTASALRRLPRHERPHRLDLPGAALMVAAAVSFLLALGWGGVRYPWLSAEILGLVGASAVFWALFAQRIATAPEPFLPLVVLRDRVVATGTAAASFAMGTLIGLSIHVPVYLELVRGLEPDEAGMALIPLMGGTVVGATTSGRVMSRVRAYKRLPQAGLLTACAALVLLAISPGGLPFAVDETLFGLVGAGLGTVLPVATVAIQNAVAPHQMGTATASMNFFRQLGAAMLVALFGAILTGGGGLGGEGHGVDAAAFVAGPDAVAAHGWVFATAALALAVSFLWFLAMPDRPLRSTVDKTAPDGA
ncbi:MDR family MFS transporter [Geminicoccaceae bacterium 1502E]|nr:MDR family MFS transporter [Geminicoccaceae bacterium 1502E]